MGLSCWKGINNKESLNIIWMDQNIYNSENLQYVEQLSYHGFSKIKLFTSINDAIEEIKNIKF